MLHPKGEENIGSPIEEIYPKIFERLKEKRKPIFFADLTKAKTAEILRLVLGTIESGVGYALLGALAHEAAKNKSTQPMSRRDFLKKAGIGVAGAYFATHSIRNILAEHSGDPLDQKSKTAMVNRVMTSLNEEIHPEIDGILITLRNYLVAQKMTTIARILKVDSDRKPEVAAIFGAGHFGLEKALSVGDEKRAEMIDKLLISNGLENVRKEIATIARLDFDEIKNDWAVTEIFKDPVLAPLEKK